VSNPTNPKKKTGYAELAGLGCRQHEVARGVGIDAPR
jgi:hypothetical protein